MALDRQTEGFFLLSIFVPASSARYSTVRVLVQSDTVDFGLSAGSTFARTRYRFYSCLEIFTRADNIVDAEAPYEYSTRVQYPPPLIDRSGKSNEPRITIYMDRTSTVQNGTVSYICTLP